MRWLLAVPLCFLAACSATDNLTKPGDYITAKPALSPHDTALLLMEGWPKCTRRLLPDMRQIGPNRWLVVVEVTTARQAGYVYAVDITTDEARISPSLFNTREKRFTGMIAEWIEDGKVTRCEPNDQDFAHWKTDQ